MWGGGGERYSSIDNEQWERVVKWQLSSTRLNYYYYCFYCYCYHLSAPFNVNRRIVRINITVLEGGTLLFHDELHADSIMRLGKNLQSGK